MFCSKCGRQVGAGRYCAGCGSSIAGSTGTAGKPTFLKRLADAVVMTLQQQAAFNAVAQQTSGRTHQNSNGSWSYVNDASGTSIISDGNSIDFLR